MNFRDVDIYTCRFFTLNEEKKLKFCGGAFKGKTAEDIHTIPDLQKVVAYCFWIIGKKDIPVASKYAATAFLKSLAPKFTELEKLVRKLAIDEQKKAEEKTKELTKTSGKKYV